MRKNNRYYIRKTHRYLGVIIGVQFLLWTVSGLYFSWTDLDEIHGDHFLKPQKSKSLENLNFNTNWESQLSIESMELKFIGEEAFFWINDSILVSAHAGAYKASISKEEAKQIAQNHVKENFKIAQIDFLENTNNHHEFRGRPLPAWQIHYKGNEDLTAYIDAKNGDFQTVRHRDWRWFDFLWMTHTMDYKGRDDINNLLLRIFSAFGLLTVLSGFTLFFVTSNVKRRRKKNKKTINK